MSQRKPRRSRGVPNEVRPLRSAKTAGVVLQDPSGRITAASEQAAHLLDVDGPEALTGRLALFEQGAAIRADGSDFPIEQQPGIMALRTGQTQNDVLLGVIRPGGKMRWFRVWAEPLFQVGGVVPYAVVSRFVAVSTDDGRRVTTAVGGREVRRCQGRVVSAAHASRP
jgi:PAS domain-containing protein